MRVESNGVLQVGDNPLIAYITTSPSSWNSAEESTVRPKSYRERGGSIDLNLGIDAVIRHARYLPPHGSRTPPGPSAASSFSSGGIIATSRPGSDVRLQCVLNRSGGAACSACACWKEERAMLTARQHHSPSQIEGPSGICLPRPKVVGGTIFQKHLLLLSAMIVMTTGRQIIQRGRQVQASMN